MNKLQVVGSQSVRGARSTRAVFAALLGVSLLLAGVTAIDTARRSVGQDDGVLRVPPGTPPEAKLPDDEWFELNDDDLSEPPQAALELAYREDLAAMPMLGDAPAESGQSALGPPFDPVSLELRSWNPP